MTEAKLSKLIQIEVSKLGGRVFRNQSGLHLSLDGKRKVKTGLVKGSSDLIGWTATGQFLAIEVKTQNGRVSPEQQKFINAVNKAGGLAFVARSIEDVEVKLNGLRRS